MKPSSKAGYTLGSVIINFEFFVSMLHDILKKYFGFETLRPTQEEVITHIMAGRDALVIMPTGGGKSLCYQLPAMMKDGVALVVSPLIALMKDQVDGLRANGIPAAFLNSTQEWGEQRTVEAAAREGRIKLLYVAPERLTTAGFREFLTQLPVGLIAIDEAHCISEWGHDFRPEYRQLNILRRHFPQIPVVALTATATERVRGDIIRELGLANAWVFLSSFNRANLHYRVEPKRDTFTRLLSILKKYRGEAVIIYCFSRKDTENLAHDLQGEGYQASPYHAGLNSATRHRTQEEFIRDKVNIIVATIAFGMGIDKPDVRLVVHYNLPKTIEGYYQETGRAGRDGERSECVLFYSPADLRKHRFFHDQITDEAERRRAEAKLRQMVDYGELTRCRREFLLAYFGETLPAGGCNNCDLCAAPREMTDVTTLAQKILSAVLKTGERFGARYVAEVLHGARSRAMRERGHETLSVFGIAREVAEEELDGLIRALVAHGFLIKDEGVYPTLRVSSAGKTWLKERGALSLPRIVVPPAARAGLDAGDGLKAHEPAPFDAGLFETLRQLRRGIAEELGVPPFIIFGDASLRQMSQLVPQSLASFSRITGVGEEKLQRFGPRFVPVIVEYAREHGLKEVTDVENKREAWKRRQARRSKRTVTRAGSTYEETKRLLAQKLPLSEIARRRGMTMGTIVSHLEKMRAAEVALDLSYLQPTGERFETMRVAFARLGTGSLSVVREVLGEEYSYDELRLVRMFVEKK